MGFLDRIFGRRDEPEYEPPPSARRGGRPAPAATPDEQAIERYRYLLRTAPPETIEQAHAEAFAQLTPDQRRMVLQELTADLPAHEREAGVRYDDDPRSLARLATRAEMRQPGTMERTFNRLPAGGAGIGLGGMMAGSFFGSFAGLMIGSAVASQFFEDSGSDSGDAGSTDAADAGQDAGSDPGADQGADATQADTGDAGGDFGDFGGGDFGGGDFGGGDFGGNF
jgi:hypothetical protein